MTKHTTQMSYEDWQKAASKLRDRESPHDKKIRHLKLRFVNDGKIHIIDWK